MVSLTAPYLTDDEIADLCAPLVMPAAQARVLERMGFLVKKRPNGRPVVARCEFERVMSGGQAMAGAEQNQPAEVGSVADLQAWARKRKGGSGGAKAQGR